MYLIGEPARSRRYADRVISRAEKGRRGGVPPTPLRISSGIVPSGPPGPFSGTDMGCSTVVIGDGGDHHLSARR